ncbi:lysophospholipid acyltransferase 5 [Contarinia nasturtii]|uniref:lysophospholipid acyltransferase 5 n=1 Tax=Contarinia nasturtii TaxID=265458 RepID=UPI0012D46FBB|nr:lysophospholipid acyltransferase 5 [Contarinia nasturtii]XP_031630817.1 lysophospholipid acyltransferase 5 [Contarinia nasturtii]XP_031630824.1 lysophospholipid acyltransferase 5 [Contarinia nasturtii]
MAADTILGRMAQSVGATEPALRLLISILVGYPLAVLYRKKFYTQTKTINHLYILTTGILICLFNYGWLMYHSLSAVLVSYALIVLFNGTTLVATTFLFNMTYLMIGYYKTATETYDITWTMPHCVLTLRLIGLAFNIADGQRNDTELSATQKKLLVKEKPSLLEVAAFTYFPASFLVGPQFSFQRYLSFINKEFDKHDGYFMAGAKRAAVGMCYLIVNVVGSVYLNDKYVMSSDFTNDHGIVARLFLVALWARITLYKYISCWLLTESVAICFGITFNGVDENGVADWSGCSNIKLLVFENTRRFQHYIDSFNVQTNHWIAEYVYKRLRFLGNRNYSQLGALVFLAIWHGFHSGYYITFAMEFAVIICEREMEPVFARSEQFQKFANTLAGKVIIFILLKLYTFIGMGFCFGPLVLLSFHRWWALHRSLWFYGYILWFSWPIYKPVLKQLLGTKKAERKKE